MEIIKTKDFVELSNLATDIFIDVLNNYQTPIIGLATGSTPELMYNNLVKNYQAGKISFEHMTSFNLDEYVGLGAEHPYSYRYYMEKYLFGEVNINKDKAFVPDGLATDLTAECQWYEEQLKQAGKIHLQILGMGLNGHIAFNEPGTSFDSRTHVIELTESTRKVNSRFFSNKDEVPTHALTMGIGTIMEAEHILFLVQGEHKAEILKKVVSGDVTEEVPASVLQTHPNVTIITDIDL